MGGVDLFDQFVATYRARIRSKRWWWPFFAWSLNAAAVNAWLLHKKIEAKNVPMLAFMREIVLTMLSSSGRKKISRLQYPETFWKIYVSTALTTLSSKENQNIHVAKSASVDQYLNAISAMSHSTLLLALNATTKVVFLLNDLVNQPR